MTSFDFTTVIKDVERMGLTDVVLPFLLIFTIIFAALQKTRVLGDKKCGYDRKSADERLSGPDMYARYTGKKYNMIVSLVISLLIVIGHVVYGGRKGDGELLFRVGGHAVPDVVDLINNSIPAISLWIVGILMFLLIVGLFAKKLEVWGHPLSMWISILAIIVVGYIFGVSAGWWGQKGRGLVHYLHLDRSDTQAGLIVILVFAIIIGFVLHEPKKGASGYKQAINYLYGGPKSPFVVKVGKKKTEEGGETV